MALICDTYLIVNVMQNKTKISLSFMIGAQPRSSA